MKQGYLIGLTHALPSVVLIDAETGISITVHGGSNIENAKYWFNHFNKADGYNVEEINQEELEKYIYENKKKESQIPQKLKDIFERNAKANTQTNEKETNNTL